MPTCACYYWSESLDYFFVLYFGEFAFVRRRYVDRFEG